MTRAAIVAVIVALSYIGRGSPQAAPAVSPQSVGGSSPQAAAARRAAVRGYDVVHIYPHDAQAFTQGLIVHDGFLYESTGLNGRSSLRKVQIETGRVVQQRAVDKQYFAEGLTDWRNRLVQLTWETGVGFVYDLSTFSLQTTFAYTGEGWGLTHDDRQLIMSDGSASLRFVDPETLEETGRVRVTDDGRPIERLNELEFVDGRVYANVWLTDRIAVIDPSSGRVDFWLDLANLRGPARPAGDDVLNGIAYDAGQRRLFVTGKLWSRLSRNSRSRSLTAAVAVRAHAKINLDLRVLGTRADGFHELRTVFQAIALHDVVECVARDGPLELECDTAGVPLDPPSNLVWKAADALWRSLRRTGEPRDVMIRLRKQIPLQAGLGGGSADAAATLMALSALWRVPVRPAQMSDVAATLGADVPFFLSGGTALGLGRGDEVYPLADLPRHWIVLLIPGFGVSTVEAYGWYNAEREAGHAVVRDPQYVPGPWPSRAAQMVNDLEAPIARHHPEIDQMKSALRRAGAVAAAMSGSGSTVFGLFQKRADASAAVRKVSGFGWRVLVTESLDRGEYARLSRPRRLRLAGRR